MFSGEVQDMTLRQIRLVYFYQELATPSYKSPSFGKSFAKVFIPFHTKALVDDKVYGKFDEFATNTVKFATSEPLSSTERL